MRLSVLTAAGIAAALTFPTVPPAAQQRRVMPPPQAELSAPVDVPMLRLGGRPYVEAHLGDTGPVGALIDTGASGTVIDAGLIAAAGLTVIGRARVGSPAGGEPIEADLVLIEAMTIGTLRIAQLNAVALDLESVFRSPDAPRIVLSPNALPGMLITFDFPGERVRIERGELTPEGTYGYGSVRPFPSLPIEIGDLVLEAEIDTGSGYPLSLPDSYEARVALLDTPVAVEPARSVLGEIPMRAATLRDPVMLAGVRREGVEVRFGMPEDVVNVGAPMLEDMVLTLDPANRRFALVRRTIGAS